MKGHTEGGSEAWRHLAKQSSRFMTTLDFFRRNLVAFACSNDELRNKIYEKSHTSSDMN